LVALPQESSINNDKEIQHPERRKKVLIQFYQSFGFQHTPSGANNHLFLDISEQHGKHGSGRRFNNTRKTEIGEEIFSRRRNLRNNHEPHYF